jgi:glycosyltransferase involved in cell wall biosynthesis
MIMHSGFARSSELVLIPGSGVDTQYFSESSATVKEDLVLFPARMLRDKGALEFIAAARALHGKGVTWRFVMAGAADYDNPSSVSGNELQRAMADGVIEWLGHVDEMRPLFMTASIVCLPSYREGMPKALLEAAAAGCAVVTTDTPGCRESILPGVSGDLVPPRQVGPLVAALDGLIGDRLRRESYGRAGRKLAADRFDIRAINNQITDIYEDSLKHG